MGICLFGGFSLAAYGVWRLFKSYKARQEREAAFKRRARVDAAFEIARKRVNLDAARSRLERERRELARLQQGIVLHNPAYQPLTSTTSSLPNLSSSIGEGSGLVSVVADVHRDGGQDLDRIDVLGVDQIVVGDEALERRDGLSGGALVEQNQEGGARGDQGAGGVLELDAQTEDEPQVAQGAGDLGRGQRDKKKNVRLTGYKVNLKGYHSE